MAGVGEPSFAAVNKSETRGGSQRKLLSWLKSVNPYSQLNATRVQSVSSTSVAPDTDPGNDKECAELIALGRKDTTDLADSTPSNSTEQSLSPSSTTPDMQSIIALQLVKPPACVDPANPIKVALAIAKVIIQIADRNDKDELAPCLEEMSNSLLAVKRTEFFGVPWVAKNAMEKLKGIIREETKNLGDLSRKWLVTKPFDHEKYRKTVGQVFQSIHDAATSFQAEMATTIQDMASRISDDDKKASLKSLHPSKKADHKNEQLKREECSSGTRVQILNDITKWANESSSDSPRVFWLTGQAGSGKTTIAYTIARRFEKGGSADQHAILGGNFLCSRQFEETQGRTQIIPTIAYQLARKCKPYADVLHVADKFDAVNRDVVTQLKDLLIGPWQHSEPMRRPKLPPYLIIIDALDEIKDDGGSAFLHDLLAAIDEYDLRGLKFLVTSRPNLEVVKLLKSFASEANCRLQEVPIEEAKPDVELYVKERLKELDGRPELDELVKRAGGLFVYAATAVRYLAGSVTVEEQIDMLKDLFSKSHKPPSGSDAFLLIDNLYRQIMLDAFSDLDEMALASRLCILYTCLCTAERTSASTVALLVHRHLVLGGEDKAVRAVLRDLHAVLYTRGDRIYWHHSSFADFIFTQARSNFRIRENNFAFSCNEPSHHKFLSESCFRIMKSSLRFNMGNIPSSFLFDRDNTIALSKQINQNIGAGARYASRYWTHHLATAELTNTDYVCDSISEFLQIRILFWIEAMNLLGISDQCTAMLQYARQWVIKCGNRYLKLAGDLDEAAHFATYFATSPVAESTPHLYISALATWPQTNSLCQSWKKQFSRIPLFTRVQPPTVDGHTGKITSVTFSADGMRIVSGSDDRSVRIWNAHTGVQMQVFEGHTGSVTSVAISVDGTWIVSGSDDESVRVWDVTTGVQLQVFSRHTCKVSSVAFSIDGTRIGSGSHDKSVRIWDTSTGMQMQLLKGHTDYVTSIAFSPDATQIVSGSNDKSVRIWDVSRGVQMQMLNGHTLSVSAVAFSTCGTHLASGSHDTSVRIWDVSTGVQLQVLNGHTDWVTSISFSAHDTWIVSGSRDQSVRVWDALKGTHLQMFTGHTHHVTSVASSPNGMDIVSGSTDKSIYVWHIPQPVKPNQPLWTRTSKNWVVSSLRRDHLMWVPNVAHLIRPFNTLIISNGGFAAVDFHPSMIGDGWVQCYTPYVRSQYLPPV